MENQASYQLPQQQPQTSEQGIDLPGDKHWEPAIPTILASGRMGVQLLQVRALLQRVLSWT